MSPETTDDSVDSPSQAQSLSWTGDFRWATLDRPVGVVVVLITLVPFWNLDGVVGVLAWLALAGSWLLFPPIVPVVFGQFILVALTPADTMLTAIIPAEVAILALFAASFLDSRAWLPTGPKNVVEKRQNLADALGYFGAAIATAALVVYAVQISGPLLAGGLCLGIITVVAIVLRPALSQ